MLMVARMFGSRPASWAASWKCVALALALGGRAASACLSRSPLRTAFFLISDAGQERRARGGGAVERWSRGAARLARQPSVHRRDGLTTTSTTDMVPLVH